MTDKRLAKIDARIALLRERLERAERLRQALADDPDLLDDLVGDSPEVNGKETSHRAPKGNRGRPPKSDRGVFGGKVTAGHFAKIVEFLERNGKPQTVAEISEGAGLHKNAVIHILYKTHKSLFERLPVEGHSTKKAWKLKRNWREATKE